jgi:lipoprotein-releasing system permease protein
MKMIEHIRFILSIAVKHLSGKKRQTILVIAGVTIGSMVMILTLSLGEGIVQDIKDKIIETSPYIVITGEKILPKETQLYHAPADSSIVYSMVSRVKPNEKKQIKPYPETMAMLSSVKNINGAAPFVFTRGVLRYHTITKQGLIKGIVPSLEIRVGNLESKVVTGSLNELSFTKDGVLLGIGLSKKLKAGYHNIISITGESGKVFRVRVVGTFASGFGAIDDNNAYINLALAQQLNNVPENAVSGIGIHTVSLDVVNETSMLLQKMTGYKTETWEETNENVITLFKRNNSITVFLVLFVFIVSGFGIANVLITIVLQKQNDIAIMKSMGVSRRSIESIFVIEGIILGIIGALLGGLAGHLLTNLISSLPISYGESAVVRNDHIVTVQRAYFYLLTTVFSIVISAVSSLGPARRAARLNPVEILRG